MPRNQLFACVIRQYGTGNYRSCVSFDRENTICLNTHQDEASAMEEIDRFLETYQKEKIKTPEEIVIFLDAIRPKEASPRP